MNDSGRRGASLESFGQPCSSPFQGISLLGDRPSVLKLLDRSAYINDL